MWLSSGKKGAGRLKLPGSLTPQIIRGALSHCHPGLDPGGRSSWPRFRVKPGMTNQTDHHSSQTLPSFRRKPESRRLAKSLKRWISSPGPRRSRCVGAALGLRCSDPKIVLRRLEPEMKLPCVYILASPDKSGQWHALCRGDIESRAADLAA